MIFFVIVLTNYSEPSNVTKKYVSYVMLTLILKPVTLLPAFFVLHV